MPAPPRLAPRTRQPVSYARARRLALLSALLPAAAFAGPAPPGLHAAEWSAANDRSAEPPPAEFTLINYFFTRATFTNQLADPSGLRGVSLGPLGPGPAGSATGTGDDTKTIYAEQRWIPVFAYSPHFADGLATFRAQLEVDYTWGMAANTVQPNQGGGFNADQINIQTKNVNVALTPLRKPRALAIHVGTQSVYDTPYDPTITPLFDLVQTGYKLAFLGSDATGVSVYSDTDLGLFRGMILPLGAAQPDKAEKGDARFSYVWLGGLDYARRLTPDLTLGLTYWHLQDDTQGAAYTYEGLLKSGPSSGGLSAYIGTQRFQIDEPSGHVEYVGGHFNYNLAFRSGPFGASGFLMFNTGRFENEKKYPTPEQAAAVLQHVDVSGFASNLELLYNFGKTRGSLITLEGMFTTGDNDPTDDKYSSPFTMNYYGLPGAVWFNHKTLLLFPFTSTVGNYTGAITDISNQGYGLMAGIASASHDLIANTLNLKLGTAYARTAAQPVPLPDGTERGRSHGVEINAELKYHFRYLMTAGLHVGYLLRGDFYDGNTQVDADPWAAFTTFTWYAF
ncbi:hypothetical protein L6V77_11640 [Myxococcota bacterium]|nr:hypothetical protein [Myxococcota bacterium]